MFSGDDVNVCTDVITSSEMPIPRIDITNHRIFESGEVSTIQTITHVHSMVTRSKVGVIKPNPKYAMTVEAIPLEPKIVKTALKHPGWFKAMQEEIHALKLNNTWQLVPREANSNIVGCKWVYKTKLKADGSLERLKAKLIAKGFSQQEGVDYSETFSHVIKLTTVRVILTLATISNWEVRQLDSKNAFLHGDLQESVMMEQPPGFIDDAHPDYVCQLKKAVYGLKQAPRAWFNQFSDYLLSEGFVCTNANSSLFVAHHDQGVLYLLLYVDDILVTGNNIEYLTEFIQKLGDVFAMRDLGKIHYFLGIEVTHTSDGLFLCQS